MLLHVLKKAVANKWLNETTEVAGNRHYPISGCVQNHSHIPFHSVVRIYIEIIIPLTQSIPQCIMKSSVKQMVTDQASYTIMHYTGWEN